MWPLFSCARVCLTVHALVGPSIRPSILVVVLCACVRACVPVRVYLFVKPLYALVRCACGACERGFGVFAVRVCVSVRVYLCACICARVYVCACVLEVYTQSAHCWCVSVGSVHSFVCIDVYFLNMYMCVLCE